MYEDLECVRICQAEVAASWRRRCYSTGLVLENRAAITRAPSFSSGPSDTLDHQVAVGAHPVSACRRKFIKGAAAASSPVSVNQPPRAPGAARREGARRGTSIHTTARAVYARAVVRRARLRPTRARPRPPGAARTPPPPTGPCRGAAGGPAAEYRAVERRRVGVGRQAENSVGIVPGVVGRRPLQGPARPIPQRGSNAPAQPTQQCKIASRQCAVQAAAFIFRSLRPLATLVRPINHSGRPCREHCVMPMELAIDDFIAQVSIGPCRRRRGINRRASMRARTARDPL